MRIIVILKIENNCTLAKYQFSFRIIFYFGKNWNTTFLNKSSDEIWLQIGNHEDTNIVETKSENFYSDVSLAC